MLRYDIARAELIIAFIDDCLLYATLLPLFAVTMLMPC